MVIIIILSLPWPRSMSWTQALSSLSGSLPQFWSAVTHQLTSVESFLGADAVPSTERFLAGFSVV